MWDALFIDLGVMPFLSFVQGLVAARKLLEGHAAVLRLLVQLPAPALAAVVALDRVGGIGGVLVRVQRDLRHHRRDDLGLGLGQG